jgi:hypothetical protein
MERRNTDRVPLRLVVDHIVSEEDHCLCLSEDLSAEGIRLRRLPGQQWGQPRFVWLQFRLPDEGRLIRALGEVRYDGRASVRYGQAEDEPVRGFRFKYINPSDRRRWVAFVESGANAA